MRVLCVYATRQIDSNLFMSSTIFNGLQQCGYQVDMLFCGPAQICDSFKSMYSHYFDNVFYLPFKESFLRQQCKKNPKALMAHNVYRQMIMDRYCRPYKLSSLKSMIRDNYDEILTFIPIALGGFLANDVRKRICNYARLTQYWTDPISLGRLDDIKSIPKSRFVHRWIEKIVIQLADRIVFCYPLFCDSMQEMYPEYADRMSWCDIPYIKHKDANYKPNNKKITIGLFGAYQEKVRNIWPLLNVMSAFPNVQFIIRGDSDIQVDASKYPNLDVKPGRVPVGEVEQLEKNCDILLCLAGKSGITIPAGKVFYYGDYNKPILYISDGKNKDYCTRYMKGFGRYEVCDNTEESIVEGIKSCIESLPGYQVSIPERMEPATVARKILENK